MSTAYRYWRIYITAITGSATDNTSIGELELRSATTGLDLTTPSTPCSQSGYNTDFSMTAAKAINNTTSWWGDAWLVNNNPPAWVMYDLGVPEFVGAVAIKPRPDFGLVESPRNFLVEASANAVTWTTVGIFTNAGGYAYDQFNVFALSANFVSGTVQDVNGAFCSRPVHVHSRATGQLLEAVTSDETTGAWSVNMYSAAEVYVVILDDVANALIYDHIAPVPL